MIHRGAGLGRTLANPSSPDTLKIMVSYAELCQAIERWQRSQGRVTALESALQQAMWRGFIQHHAPDVQMDFQSEQRFDGAQESPHENHHENHHQNYQEEQYEEQEPGAQHFEQPVSLEDDASIDNLDSLPYAATGS